MTAVRAEVIIIIECRDDGLKPAILMIINGMNIPPNPYTARTTSENTELFPEKYAPKERQVATNAIAIVDYDEAMVIDVRLFALVFKI